MRTDVWFPRTSKNGGMSAVTISNQAMYNGALTVPLRGIGKVLKSFKKKQNKFSHYSDFHQPLDNFNDIRSLISPNHSSTIPTESFSFLRDKFAINYSNQIKSNSRIETYMTIKLDDFEWTKSCSLSRMWRLDLSRKANSSPSEILGSVGRQITSYNNTQ